MAHSLHPAQHLGISMEMSSTEREGVEGNVELRRKVRGAFLHATIFNAAAANLCLDMSSCRLCAFYISIEVNHELAYPTALPRSGCCWKKGNLITALPGPGLPQKQLKLRALPKAIQTTPMGSRLAPNLTCPCGMERRAPLQRGAG